MSVSVNVAAPHRTPFTGRDSERAALQRALDETCAAQGHFVLLLADAGLGKSRLCEELAASARHAGILQLSGQCIEGEASIPYLPFVELIEAATAALPADDLRDMTEAGASALSIIAPRLGSEAQAALQRPEEHKRPALFAAVRDFLDRLSRRSPVLIVIEDIHWADASTVLLLRNLVRYVSQRRLLVVATCRGTSAEQTDAGAGIDALIDEIHRERGASVLELADLGAGDAASMVAALAGREPPASVAEALYSRTGGNPLFIEQVVTQLLDEGRLFDDRGRWLELTSFDDVPVPESLRRVVARRLQRTDDACRRVLSAAAVAGLTSDYRLIAAVSELPAKKFLESVEEAERASLITVARGATGLCIVFRHNLIRHAILGRTSLARRQELHIEIARAIERMFDTSRGDYDGDLAQHYIEAGADIEKTLHYVTSAAHRALAATAYEEAARLYSAAITLVPASDVNRRCSLLIQCGEARKRVSDSDLAREAFGAAALIARESGDADQLAAAALGFARSWPTVSSVDAQAVELLTAALDAAPADNRVMRARIMSRRALQLLYCGDPPEVERIAREAVNASRASGDDMTLARALQVLHAALWQPAHLHERLAIATEIIELAGAVGDQSVALWGMRPRIADTMELGDVAEAEADVAAYERVAAATRLPIYLWQGAVRRAMMAIFRGHLDEGERLAQHALELGRQAEGQNLMAAFGGQLLVIKWQQGKVEDLRALIAASRQNQPHVKLWAAVLAFIEVGAGNTTEARAQFEELASDRFASLPNEDTRLVVIALASLVCAALGDGIRAEQLYELLLPYEGRNIVVSEGVVCVGAAAQYLGMLSATARRWADAARHFDDAIELNTRSGGRPWLARTAFEYARLLLVRRQSGDRRRAGDLLRRSLGIARDTGLIGLQEEIEAVLRSHRRLLSDTPGDLTKRECEVLRLIAGGLSTREISEALVLSERTSARHITNIYAKIGARNRVEATVYARRHELDR